MQVYAGIECKFSNSGTCSAPARPLGLADCSNNDSGGSVSIARQNQLIRGHGVGRADGELDWRRGIRNPFRSIEPQPLWPLAHPSEGEYFGFGEGEDHVEA